MKAVIETMEPVIRPASSVVRSLPKTHNTPVRFVATRVANPLFHAWRA